MPQGALPFAPAVTPQGVAVPLNLDALGNLLITQGSGESPQSVKPAGATPYNDAAGTAGHQIKTGAGVLQNLNVNTAGTSTHTTLYDGTSTSGTKLGTYDTTSLHTANLNLAFTVGLFVVSSTVTPADITIGYF